MVIASATAWLAVANGQAANVGCWINTVSGGYWTDPLNWASGAVPNAAGDAAFIAATQAANHVILLGSNITVGRLVVEDDGYVFGISAGASNLTFDNNGAGASLAVVDTGGRNASTTFSNGFTVAEDLRLDLSTVNSTLDFRGPFLGATDRTMDVNYTFSGANPALQFSGNNTGYLGRVNLRGNGTTRGWYVNSANNVFGGGTGSIRVVANAFVSFKYTAGNAETRRFAFTEEQNTLALQGGGAAFTNVANSQDFVVRGGSLTLGDANSSSSNRWPDTDPVPLDSTTVNLTGYGGGTVPFSALETIGPVTFDGGCWVNVVHQPNANGPSATKLLPYSIERAGSGTLVFRSGGGRLGTASNQCYATGPATPAVSNGMVRPYYAYTFGTPTGANSNSFATYGAYGFAPADFDQTDDFTAAETKKVLVTSNLNLGGAAVACYALCARGPIINGTVRIDSGGLIVNGAFYSHQATFAFGPASNSEALIMLTGHPDVTKSIYLRGSLAASNLTKFGRADNPLRIYGSNPGLLGAVRVNEGIVEFGNPAALNPWNDLVLRCNARADTVTNLNLGGLTGPYTALLGNNSATPATVRLNPAAGGTNVFDGSIGQTVGPLALTLAGPGCQMLNGSNSYLGATAIDGGALLVNGALASTSVVVNAGGLLGGAGVLNGTLTVAANGRLAPGGSGRTATLTVNGNAVLLPGAVYEWECRVTGVDLTDVRGTLTLPAVATVCVSVAGGAPGDPPVLLTAGALAGAPDLSHWVVYPTGLRAAVSGNRVILAPGNGALLTVR